LIYGSLIALEIGIPALIYLVFGLSLRNSRKPGQLLARYWAVSQAKKEAYKFRELTGNDGKVYIKAFPPFL